MADDDDEQDEPIDPMARPDGHRYEAPESDQDRRSKGIDYAILGLVVVVILILIATGKVPFFG